MVKVIVFFTHVSSVFHFDYDIVQKEPETSELEKGAVKAVQDLYDVVHHDILFGDKRSETC